jgi:predicted DNA binding protein
MVVSGREDEGSIELTLDIWHPQCWTLHVTEDTEADLLGHSLYSTKDTVYGLFTAAAQSIAEVDQVITDIQESALTGDVWTMDSRDRFETTVAAVTATRGFLVEWGIDTGENIVYSLVDHSFVPRRTYQMTGGCEQWSVITTMDRHEAQEQLRDVSAETDADIDIQRITSNGRQPSGPYQLDVLSLRQREVFEYACQQGYYDWLRTVSATDLAEDLGITKATVTEHLRKAEFRLFTPYR